MIYVIWNTIHNSVNSLEDGEGWPSYAAALSACSEPGDAPALRGQRGLVLGAAACAKGEAALLAAYRRQAVDSASSAATLASIVARAPVIVEKPDRAVTLAKLLASNEAAIATCKKSDRDEIARLRDNCARLRAELAPVPTAVQSDDFYLEVL